ncbi:pilus assembly protein [Kineococcus rhizosphaerae]|nr:pilus assembly protein [Kineococcus rhizosphaerae]
MITVMFAVVLVVGLVVDGSSRMNAIQAADHAAAEAARAGAQAVPRTPIQSQGVARSSSGTQAVAAANAYLAAAGVSGSVAVGGRGSLSVTTSVPWTPKFLSAIGVGTSNVEGRAEVSLVQSVESRPS